VRVLKVKENFLLSVFIVLFSVFYVGCSQDQAGIESPVDKVTIDSNLNEMVSKKNMNAANGIGSQDKSYMNELKAMEGDLSVVNFKFDQFDVDGSMEDVLSKNGEILNNTKFSDKNIKLEGNCDEWGSDEYNYALGLKRAKSVKEFLISEGVNKTRISIISFGESNPVCKEKTKSCWYKNRRVSTKLLP